MMQYNPIFRLSSLQDAMLGVLCILLIAAFLRSRRRRFAPGPTGLPFAGVALQISDDKQWLKFHEWIRRYGA